MKEHLKHFFSMQKDVIPSSWLCLALYSAEKGKKKAPRDVDVAFDVNSYKNFILKVRNRLKLITVMCILAGKQYLKQFLPLQKGVIVSACICLESNWAEKYKTRMVRCRHSDRS